MLFCLAYKVEPVKLKKIIMDKGDVQEMISEMKRTFSMEQSVLLELRELFEVLNGKLEEIGVFFDKL